MCIQKYTVVSDGDLHVLVYTFLYGVRLCDCIFFDTVMHKGLVYTLYRSLSTFLSCQVKICPLWGLTYMRESVILYT